MELPVLLQVVVAFFILLVVVQHIKQIIMFVALVIGAMTLVGLYQVFTAIT